MVRRLIAVAVLMTASQVFAQPATQPAQDDYKKASYGVGFNLGKSIKSSGLPMDVDKMVDGLRDAVAGKTSQVSDADFKAAMTKVQAEGQARAEQNAKLEGAKQESEGKAYREANAKKPGVKVTASGLQYQSITEGTGASPKLTDTVKVHYTGKLIDGTTFDSSVDRGEPISFPLGRVIKGWGEGLQLMKVGGKATLVIPPDLGYGAEGAGNDIPPNATLVFTVELLGIEKPADGLTMPIPGR
ncbi:MAG TPA: FKBP-type peptidyl-prolyl cis-trans isomerase [Tepidisphaeraceae bacterium]|nr:FKBP-type peptidyl-prolyl cis-trans isomerase [Tepidisphaeraceae bacterium]